MWEHIVPIAVSAGFILNLLGTVVGVTWKLSRVETSIMGALKIERKEIDGEFDKVRREVGEVGHALREKIREVELFTRDNFVRTPVYTAGQDEVKKGLLTLGSEIKTRLERMESKIDSKT